MATKIKELLAEVRGPQHIIFSYQGFQQTPTQHHYQDQGFEYVWQEDEEIMGRTFVEYFTQLFKSSQAKVNTLLIEAIQVKVTKKMNILLL